MSDAGWSATSPRLQRVAVPGALRAAFAGLEGVRLYYFRAGIPCARVLLPSPSKSVRVIAVVDNAVYVAKDDGAISAALPIADISHIRLDAASGRIAIDFVPGSVCSRVCLWTEDAEYVAYVLGTLRGDLAVVQLQEPSQARAPQQVPRTAEPPTPAQPGVTSPAEARPPETEVDVHEEPDGWLRVHGLFLTGPDCIPPREATVSEAVALCVKHDCPGFCFRGTSAGPTDRNTVFFRQWSTEKGAWTSYQRPSRPPVVSPSIDAPDTEAASSQYAPIQAAPPRAQPVVHGARRAVLVGCRYGGSGTGAAEALSSVQMVRHFLERAGFERGGGEVRVLTDANPSSTPTRYNVEAALTWLAEGAQPGDSLFLYLCGHGGGLCFAPIDFDTAGLIQDEDVMALVVKRLPPACRLTVICDFCCGGALLDLPHSLSVLWDEDEPKREQPSGWRNTSVEKTATHPDRKRLLWPAKDERELAVNIIAAQSLGARTDAVRATVVQLAGCTEAQTVGGTAGRLTAAFLAGLNSTQQPCAEVLSATAAVLLSESGRDKRPTPRISSSRPLQAHEPLHLSAILPDASTALEPAIAVDKLQWLFEKADRDGDGALKEGDMQWLASVTGGDFDAGDYGMLCAALGADPAVGLSPEHLLRTYTEMGAGYGLDGDYQRLRRWLPAPPARANTPSASSVAVIDVGKASEGTSLPAPELSPEQGQSAEPPQTEPAKETSADEPLPSDLAFVAVAVAAAAAAAKRGPAEEQQQGKAGEAEGADTKDGNEAAKPAPAKPAPKTGGASI